MLIKAVYFLLISLTLSPHSLGYVTFKKSRLVYVYVYYSAVTIILSYLAPEFMEVFVLGNISKFVVSIWTRDSSLPARL